MSSISFHLSNQHVPSNFPTPALSSIKNQMDKVTKIAVVAILALAFLVGLSIRYKGKIKSWFQTPFVNIQSYRQRLDVECQKATHISLDRAKDLKDDLKVLCQTAKSENDLIEYFKVSPNVERIYLSKSVISKKLLENLPKKTNLIELIDCRFTDLSLEGLQSLDNIHSLDLTLQECNLKNVNIILPAQINSLHFSFCSNVSLKSVSAKRCTIIECKNLSIDNESKAIDDLYIYNCKDFSLNHLPKTLERLLLFGCPNLPSLEHLPNPLKSLSIDWCSRKHPTLDRLPTDLAILSLEGDYLSTQSLDALPSKLQTLVLTSSSKIPSLEHLPQGLRRISFERCDLTNICRDFLAHLPQNLKTIEFERCDLTNISRDFLAHLPQNLKTIEFEYCDLKTVPMVFLKHLPQNLETIKFFGCGLTNISMSFLKYLPQNLQTIKFTYCDLTNMTMVFRAHLLQNLKTIEFCYCNLTNISMVSFPDSLQSIIFNNCQGVSLNDFPKKIRNKVLIE